MKDHQKEKVRSPELLFLILLMSTVCSKVHDKKINPLVPGVYIKVTHT